MNMMEMSKDERTFRELAETHLQNFGFFDDQPKEILEGFETTAPLDKPTVGYPVIVVRGLEMAVEDYLLKYLEENKPQNFALPRLRAKLGKK